MKQIRLTHPLDFGSVHCKKGETVDLERVGISQPLARYLISIGRAEEVKADETTAETPAKGDK